jgi:hypothetical protein
VPVEAYSGYRADERPTAFVLDGKRHEVAEVLDRWYEGGLQPRDQRLDYHKVRTTEGREFLMRYNFQFDVWSVMLDEPSGHAPAEA